MVPTLVSALDLKANPAVGSLGFRGQLVVLWVSAIVQDFGMDGDRLLPQLDLVAAEHLLTNI